MKITQQLFESSEQIDPKDIFYIIKKKMEDCNYPTNVQLKCISEEKKKVMSQVKRVKYIVEQSDLEIKKLMSDNRKLKNICISFIEKLKKTI